MLPNVIVLKKNTNKLLGAKKKISVSAGAVRKDVILSEPLVGMILLHDVMWFTAELYSPLHVSSSMPSASSMPASECPCGVESRF